jgi:hypothetical protein
MTDEDLLAESTKVVRVLMFASVLVLGAIALGGLVTWTPPVHPIVTPGARPVKAHDGGWVPLTAVPAPTMSLSAVRCDAWESRTRTVCPDDATLSVGLWPGLAQTPRTLYVAFSSGSLGGPVTNVEYEPRSRTLTIHGCAGRPLLVVRFGSPREGTELQASLGLLVVSTDGIPTGKMTVVGDGWIERLTGDEQRGSATLGTVEIASG